MNPASEPSMQGPFALYERRYLAPLLVSLPSFKGAVFLIYLALVIPIRFDITFPEGAIVARAAEVAAGGPAYADWRVWPHQFAPYGPLTYYPAGWAARMLGRSKHPMELYAVGRFQSFLAIIGIITLIAGMGRILAGGWIWGVLAAAGFLAWRLQMEFAISFRPDAPALFFALLALALAFNSTATTFRVICAFAALWVSFWFKATAFGTGLALTMWVWRGRGWRTGLVALTAFAASGLLSALALDHRMEGRLFLNLLHGLDNGLDLMNWWKVMIPSPTIPSIIMITGGALALRNAVRSDSPHAFMARSTVIILVAATLQMFKIGASYNYYMEFHALASLQCAVGAADLWRGRGRARTATLWLVVTPLVLYDAHLGLGRIVPDLKIALRARQERELFRRVGDIEGPLLVQTSDLALIRPAPPTILDYVHYSLMVRRGYIDPADLPRRVRGKEFAAVVFVTHNLESARSGRPDPFVFFSPDFVRILDENYVETERLEPMSILRPRRDEP